MYADTLHAIWTLESRATSYQITQQEQNQLATLAPWSCVRERALRLADFDTLQSLALHDHPDTADAARRELRKWHRIAQSVGMWCGHFEHSERIPYTGAPIE